MRENKSDIRVTVDGYTRTCLAVIAVLLTILIVGLWAEQTSTSDEAYAGEIFLNSSKQRDAMVAAQNATTQRIDQLIKLLESGKVKVQITESDRKATGAQNVIAPKSK